MTYSVDLGEGERAPEAAAVPFTGVAMAFEFPHRTPSYGREHVGRAELAWMPAPQELTPSPSADDRPEVRMSHWGNLLLPHYSTRSIQTFGLMGLVCTLQGAILGLDLPALKLIFRQRICPT
jgi:hypothetical protein